MQYIYVLDYSTPSRITIKVADDVDVSEKIDDILSVNHLKASECSWMVSNKPLYDEVAIWCKYKEGSLPPEDVDVIAYNKKWIDADNNPKGIRIGFRVEDRFYSAQWDGDSNYSTHCSDDNDYYEHNGKDEQPEYWIDCLNFLLSNL